VPEGLAQKLPEISFPPENILSPGILVMFQAFVLERFSITTFVVPLNMLLKMELPEAFIYRPMPPAM